LSGKVFVSFDHNDKTQADTFKALLSNSKHPLDFHDRSLKDPVTGQKGKHLPFLPNDKRADPIKEEIKKKFEEALVLLVLIGRDTHKSKWIDWEINTFHKMKFKLYGNDTWKLIRAMKIKGIHNVTLPNALNGKSWKTMPWGAEKLNKWLDKVLF